jgi:hypothetical protein
MRADADTIVGRLTINSDFDVVPAQREAWIEEINYLKEWLGGLSGSILLEFTIPRMGRRIDAVLLIGSLIFVVEFKIGERNFNRSDIDQVWDYALDLKNFHEASHPVQIVPILVATGAVASDSFALNMASDGVCWLLRVHPAVFRSTIDLTLESSTGQPLDEKVWARAPYRPTPTIIEAARVLYAQHSVEAITRNDAGAVNLRVTSRRIEELVDEAKSTNRKLICFVTGVPGAGKTLVGLNIATRRREHDQPTHAVFLSGNGPLVAVLREALTRDEMARHKRLGEKRLKGRVANPVKAFIQNVHHFRDEALRDRNRPPIDHVVIFDEAQRAWNKQKTATFMKQRKNQPDFGFSEPTFLLSYMNRHADWAVVICLVGGGQEIHTGEAGIGEWLDAITMSFSQWHLYISDQLWDSEYAADIALDALRERKNVYFERDLHLAVSMRSFRAENVSRFVKAVLDCEIVQASTQLALLNGRFPIAITRDLNLAKDWIRSRARGTERYGLVASSKAMRLKPYAIDIRVAVDPVHWFLDDRSDTRSSYFLEDCATEFQVQGLELDWVCVTWDGDLRFASGGWSCHDFRGDSWQNIRSSANQSYLRNAYRVLLTRARQGMVLFIPRGDIADPTRSPEFYDPTYNYLTKIGVPVLT